MLIDKIILNNFRVYHGTHEISLSINPEQNVSIISGQNGFGKTSLLTSLVWVLYGKLMVDVDDKYRREVNESGGYKKYSEKLMSRVAKQKEPHAFSELKNKLVQTRNALEIDSIKRAINELYSFSVTLKFTNIFIPHLSCNEVSIKRTYNIKSQSESLQILIDGKQNELTSTIGPDIFINDFILPKEIAKFFFFDAEKITALAEVRNLEEKLYFSKAYNEVLGIKKYTDLKQNLEHLQLRLRKKNAKKGDLIKIEDFQNRLITNGEVLELHLQELARTEEEINIKKASFTQIQEQLVRVGSSLSNEELLDFKLERTKLKEDIAENKKRFQDLLELAPFAMLARKMDVIRIQLDIEQRELNSNLVNSLLLTKYNDLKDAFAQIPEFDLKAIDAILIDKLIINGQERHKALLEFTPEQHNQFLAVYDNLQHSYSKAFKNLVADGKRLLSTYNIIQKKVQDAESKSNDPVIKELKTSYEKINADILRLETNVLELKFKITVLQEDTASINRLLSEQTKHIRVEAADQEKEATAARLIKQLENFIYQLKQKKKVSLEKNVKRELNRLMHKSDFVDRVDVKIEGDLIDIDLFDQQNILINKDGLSKGEQQLYATALLKALVTESNIHFPVFIDSPLQKLDKRHSANIIKDFYPTVSGQVVLFPLLEKELNESEYQLLLPKVGKSYLINQVAADSSALSDIWPSDLFTQFMKTQQAYV
jgi:DNA sulfur modification protein DndD